MINLILRLIILTAFLSGCAHEPSIYFTRDYPTGLENDEAVSVVLEKYFECVEMDCTDSKTQAKEQDIYNLIAQKIGKIKPNINMVPFDKFRSIAFPGQAFNDSKITPDSIIRLLNDAAFLNRISPLRLRYLIILELHASKGVVGTGVELSQFPVWGIVRSSKKNVTVTATIVDVKRKQVSGKISSSKWGESGYMVPFLLILPLPPIPYSDFVETPACTGLVEPLVRFLENKDGADKSK